VTILDTARQSHLWRRVHESPQSRTGSFQLYFEIQGLAEGGRVVANQPILVIKGIHYTVKPIPNTRITTEIAEAVLVACTLIVLEIDEVERERENRNSLLCVSYPSAQAEGKRTF
jgi:hypothetical protein